MAETQSSTRISAVGRVVLPVSDPDRALDFYVGKLGFEKRADIPYGEGDRWIEVAPAGAATTIALVPGRDETSPGTQSRIILDTDDIDGAHGDLRDRGVDVDEQVARMGAPVPPMVWFRDQDNNVLMVVERQD